MRMRYCNIWKKPSSSFCNLHGKARAPFSFSFEDVLAKHCGALLDHFDLLMPYAELGRGRLGRIWVLRVSCLECFMRHATIDVSGSDSITAELVKIILKRERRIMKECKWWKMIVLYWQNIVLRQLVGCYMLLLRAIICERFAGLASLPSQPECFNLFLNLSLFVVLLMHITCDNPSVAC